MSSATSLMGTVQMDLPTSPITPESGSMEERIIATVAQWMRSPLDLPEEFRGWLPRYLETSDVLLHPDQMFNAAQSAVPIGSMFPFAGSTAPNYYAFTDGSAVSRATYSALFAVIGTSWGGGDGSTTFNLPNIRGRTIVCRDASQSEFDTLGETGGAKTHTLTTAELAAHAHTEGSHTHGIGADGSHQHGMSESYFAVSGGWAFHNDGDGLNAGNIGTTTGFAGTHSHGGATAANAGSGTGSAGSGNAHNNLQPYVVTNIIIRTT